MERQAGGGGARANVIQLEQVTVIEGASGLIGRGALGEVRRGQLDGTDVALKGLHLLRTDAESVHAMGGALGPAERRALLDAFWQECDVLRRVVHKNILPFIGIVVDPQRSEPLYLAAQYIASGTLHDVLYSPRHAALRSNGGYLPLETQLVALEGLFAALAYLAEVPLIHRDIKPPNILALVERARLVKVLLADFGEAKQLTQTMTHVRGTMAGTPVYMAPEMRGEDDAKGPKADVFSAGVVAVELSAQQQPRPGPETQRRGGRRVLVPEEERRAADLAAVRDDVVAEIAARTVVDDETRRAAAAEMQQLCLERLQAVRPMREATIQVHIPGGQRISLPVHGATKIAELTCHVLARLGGQQQLLFAGRPMDPGRTVDDYNLLDGTVVHMLNVRPAGEDVVPTATLRAEQARRIEVERVNAQLHADVEGKDAQNAALEHEQAQLRRQLQEREVRITSLQQALEQERQQQQGRRIGGGAAGSFAEAVPPASAGTPACPSGTSVCECGRGCKCRHCGKPLPTVRSATQAHSRSVALACVHMTAYGCGGGRGV
jgi:hypothetical protein